MITLLIVLPGTHLILGICYKIVVVDSTGKFAKRERTQESHGSKMLWLLSFMFELTKEENEELRSQMGTLNQGTIFTNQNYNENAPRDYYSRRNNYK